MHVAFENRAFTENSSWSVGVARREIHGPILGPDLRLARSPPKPRGRPTAVQFALGSENTIHCKGRIGLCRTFDVRARVGYIGDCAVHPQRTGSRMDARNEILRCDVRQLRAHRHPNGVSVNGSRKRTACTSKYSARDKYSEAPVTRHPRPIPDRFDRVDLLR